MNKTFTTELSLAELVEAIKLYFPSMGFVVKEIANNSNEISLFIDFA